MGGEATLISQVIDNAVDSLLAAPRTTRARDG